MSTNLKDALSEIDLSEATIDNIPASDPQLVKAIRAVKDRASTVVAHQQHGSHSDHSNAGESVRVALKRPE